MAQFDESKHNRDTGGKFANKPHSEAAGISLTPRTHTHLPDDTTQRFQDGDFTPNDKVALTQAFTNTLETMPRPDLTANITDAFTPAEVETYLHGNKETLADRIWDGEAATQWHGNVFALRDRIVEQVGGPEDSDDLGTDLNERLAMLVMERGGETPADALLKNAQTQTSHSGEDGVASFMAAYNALPAEARKEVARQLQRERVQASANEVGTEQWDWPKSLPEPTITVTDASASGSPVIEMEWEDANGDSHDARATWYWDGIETTFDYDDSLDEDEAGISRADADKIEAALTQAYERAAALNEALTADNYRNSQDVYRALATPTYRKG